ncbi:MAG: hypothetical protein K5Q68_10535 [Roseococcus sp.]|nr:hypothetical protein [Roseococcus sp.]
MLAALLVASLFAAPAMAQQRVVVVPAGADVVIAPRGAEAPPLIRAPRPRIPPPGQAGGVPMARPVLETGGGALGGAGLAAPGLLALPLLAAAGFLAGSSVPGSSSSTSAPARTR